MPRLRARKRKTKTQTTWKFSYFLAESKPILKKHNNTTMGRGRKGLIEQSERKKKATGAYRETFTVIPAPNRQIKKIPVPEQVFVDFLLTNDGY